MADTAGYYRDRAPASVGTITQSIIKPTGIDRSSWVVQSVKGISTIGAIYLVKTRYVMRAWDSGGGGRWVTWTSYEVPNTNPSNSETSPNYSGTLSSIRVERAS